MYFFQNKCKLCFLLVLMVLVCLDNFFAQPSICPAPFDPLRTCNPHYLSKEFVFVGQIISTDTKLTEIENRQLWKVRVAVKEIIKGNPGGGTIELFLEQQCSGRSVENGKKYIFTADRMKEAGFAELISSRWSSPLNNVPDNELKKISNEIRSVTKGKKQPRIVGKVILFDSSPPGIYDFRGKSLNTKSGYNPQYSSPAVGVEVNAQPVGEDINPLKRDSYKIKTDANGNYEFKDLPEGPYELFLTLPVDLYVETFLYQLPRHEDTFFDPPFRIRAKKKMYTQVGNGICSEDIRFNVRPAGEINGRLIFENKMPAEEPFLRLLWVESETQRSDLKWATDYSFNINKSKSDPENTLEFQYSDLQVGKYILKIIFDFKDEQKNFYYPGVREIKDAEIINIKAGDAKDISIRFK